MLSIKNIFSGVQLLALFVITIVQARPSFTDGSTAKEITLQSKYNIFMHVAFLFGALVTHCLISDNVNLSSEQ